MSVDPVVLEGRHVRLEPLAPAHLDGLRAAAADPSLWDYMSHDCSGPAFDEWIAVAEANTAAGADRAFVARLRADRRIVGSSRYLNIALAHSRLEIGNTWYAREFWSGPVNPECKLLLMTHAFETLGLNRVEFRCDLRNARSRGALLKLGAVEEGILRQHMIVRDGYVRDTVQFGVTAADWPALKVGLEARLAAF